MEIDFSNPTTILVLVVVALAIILLIIAIVQNQRRARLRQKFGSEYDRTVSNLGSAPKADESLSRREAEVEKLKLRELAPPERERFLHEWFAVQSRFVDHPKGALVEADELVCSLLQARGYPATSFEQSAEHLSVDHPRLIENFRTAHAAIERSVRGEANTEELRAAMIHYRALFDELTQTKTVVP